MDKEYDILTESEARGYETLWNAFHEAVPDATTEHLTKMVSITLAICRHCRDEFDCYCDPAYDI